MTHNIAPLWRQYTDWLQESNPTEFEKLNKPATSEDFAAFKTTTGYEFPDDLRQVYSINNGATGTDSRYGEGNFNFALSHAFLPMNEILNTWKALSATKNDSFGSSYPTGAIKTISVNPKWIPILDDSGGNNIGVDLDPDVNGTVGQVINFGRDESVKFVIAASFGDFLQLILHQIEQGAVEVSTEDDGVMHWNLKGSGHLTDGLRKLVLPQVPHYTTANKKHSSLFGRLVAKFKR